MSTVEAESVMNMYNFKKKLLFEFCGVVFIGDKKRVYQKPKSSNFIQQLSCSMMADQLSFTVMIISSEKSKVELVLPEAKL